MRFLRRCIFIPFAIVAGGLAIALWFLFDLFDRLAGRDR